MNISSKQNPRAPRFMIAGILAAALLGFCIPGTARADLVDSLAATSFENYPSVADSRANAGTGLNVFRASVGAPLFVGDDTTLVVGAAYERIGVVPSAAEPFQLQGTKATFGIIQGLSEHWGMMAFGDVGLTSDFAEGVGSEDLLLSLTGIATYRWGERIPRQCGPSRPTGDPGPSRAWRRSRRAVSLPNANRLRCEPSSRGSNAPACRSRPPKRGAKR